MHNAHTPKHRQPVKIKGAAGDLIDRICDADRRFFETHPDRCSFIRDYVPGEVRPDYEPEGLVVVEVTFLAPGIRHRRILTMSDTAHN